MKSKVLVGRRLSTRLPKQISSNICLIPTKNMLPRRFIHRGRNKITPIRKAITSIDLPTSRNWHKTAEEDDGDKLYDS